MPGSQDGSVGFRSGLRRWREGLLCVGSRGARLRRRRLEVLRRVVGLAHARVRLGAVGGGGLRYGRVLQLHPFGGDGGDPERE